MNYHLHIDHVNRRMSGTYPEDVKAFVASLDCSEEGVVDMTSTRSKSGFTITFSFKCGNKVTVVHKDAMGKEMWDILHYKPDDTRFMAAYYALKHGVVYYLPPTGEVTIDPQHKLRLLAFTRWLAAMPETYPLNPKNVELAGLDHLDKMFEVAFPDHTVDSVVEEDGKLMVIVIKLLEDCIEKLAVN